MQAAGKEVGISLQKLSAQTREARLQTAAAVESFRKVREGAAVTQRTSRRLRSACDRVVLQCRADSRQSATQRRTRTALEPVPLEVAHAIARTLGELGLPAFVFDPPHDTAIHA
jgi:hypothetical protein